MVLVAMAFEGQLTASVFGQKEELKRMAFDKCTSEKVGRLIFHRHADG